jgi:kynureninase
MPDLRTSDLLSFRARFPILGERLYFATQCLGPLPSTVEDDFEDYWRTLALRNRALEEWLLCMAEVTALVENLLGAPGGTVALRDSATACQAAIASALLPAGRRSRILVAGSLDFASSRYLWRAQAQRGFEVVDVPAADGQGLTLADVVPFLDERVAVVALPLVSPRTGALLPAEVVAAAREVGAVVVLDAYQAVGIVPIDVTTLGATVVVGGTHKWLCGGGTGLAFMYVEPTLAERLQATYPGWLGHASIGSFSDGYEPPAGARRFQQGTPAMEPIYTSRSGLQFVLEKGVAALRARSLELTDRLLAACQAAGLPILTPRERERRGGMITLALNEATDVVQELAARDIDVDARPNAGVRIGPFPCLADEDCDRLVTTLVDVCGR